MSTKSEILNHYATRDPKHFLQLDADGGDMYAIGTAELMRASMVRVLITSGTPAKDAALWLRRLACWLEGDPNLMRYGDPENIPGREFMSAAAMFVGEHEAAEPQP